MEAVEVNNKTLAAAAADVVDNGSSLDTVMMGDDGVRVLESCKNGEKGKDDGGVIVDDKAVLEKRVSVETPSFGGEESEKPLGPVLEGDKEQVHEVKQLGGENEICLSNGNDNSVVAEVHVSESGDEIVRKCGGEDDGVPAPTGKVSENSISLGKEEETEHLEERREVNASEENVEAKDEVNPTEENVEAEEEMNPADEHVEAEDDDDDDDVGDGNFEYNVGDFVWGKIRSYPWWPGQIYDPSDASEYAVKLKQKDRILVAYFGDDSFSWCSPSQLKPFVENFEEMAEQSNSKSFVNAVERALDEVSRLVELETTCSCLPGDYQLKAANPSNGGVKEGVLVPVGGIGKSIVSQYKPKELISRLKEISLTNCINSLLELIVMKSWLTSYFRAKGGYSLPVYHVPLSIEGLEDNSIDGKMMNTTNLSAPVEVPVQGPTEERWFSAPVVTISTGFNQSDQNFLKKCHEGSGDILYQRRKQKSVAEIMEVEPAERERHVKRLNSGKLTSRKRKKNVHDEAGEEGKSPVTLQSSSKRKKRKAVDSGSPRTTEKNTSAETTDVGGKEADELHPSGELKRKKLSRVENGSDESKRIVASRDRKKSKYLSPPYTDHSSRAKVSRSNSMSRLECEKNNMIGERMAKVASQLIGQFTGNGTLQTEVPIELEARNGASGSLDHKAAVEDHPKTAVSMDITATSTQLLSQVRSAALDPLCAREECFIDSIAENIKAFRKSTFLDNNVQEKGLCESEKQNSELQSHQINNSNVDEEPEIPLAKRTGKDSEMRINNGDMERKAAPVALILTFRPGVSLPSRAELVNIFSKFGELNEGETDVFYNSFCARVSYERSSDAEEAFRASVEKNPFGTDNVNYRLRYPSAAAKMNESSQKPLDSAIASQPSDGDAAPAGFVRGKLKELSSMLEASDGRITGEMKSRLEGEIKGLLDKVSAIKFTSSLD